MSFTGFRWQIPPEEAFPQLTEAYVQAIRRGVHAVMQRWEPEITNWMRENAPWTDRTGLARAGLYAQVDPPTPEQIGSEIRLFISHSMFYGWYLEGINPQTMLEMQNAGLWNIISPALDYFAPRIWADIRRMLS